MIHRAALFWAVWPHAASVHAAGLKTQKRPKKRPCVTDCSTAPPGIDGKSTLTIE
nr:MAG TPA: hypothetical protein [Caudoviricetes sp.]